jgi:alpha-glucosidase (family GH31 glycosyl hydrolase)
MELNDFTTIYRTHEGNLPDENNQFYDDDASLAQFSRFAKVYAAWGFYRRELVAEAAATGLPVVRHLFIHYPDDPRVYDLRYEQFIVGSELLVAPVLDPDTNEAAAYLPAGRWVHLWTGAIYGDAAAGATIKIAAPLGETAVF